MKLLSIRMEEKKYFDIIGYNLMEIYKLFFLEVCVDFEMLLLLEVLFNCF